jgi:hypothetical protein
VYKREIMVAGSAKLGLFVERFRWDELSGSLDPASAEPVQIPLDPGETSGFYLWAGFDIATRRLLVLTQIVGADGNSVFLRLLSGDVAKPGIGLSDPGAWGTLDLPTAGFDLDAVLENGQLVCVCRDTAAPIKATIGEIGYSVSFAANMGDSAMRRFGTAFVF